MKRRDSSSKRANAPSHTVSESLEGRSNFALDELGWGEFHEILSRPLQHKPRLAQLLSEPGVLD